MFARYLSFFALFLTLPILLAGCAGNDAETTREEPLIPVRTGQVEVRTIGAEYSVAGVVKAKKKATLSFRVPGFIEKRTVNIGDHVPASAAIAKLDQRDYASEVELAEAELAGARLGVESARSDFLRVSGLYAEGMTSQQDFERSETALKLAETALAEAKTRLELSRRRLDYARLLAPYDCGVVGIHSQEGEFVTTGAPVISVCSLDPLTVEVGIPDSEIIRIKLHGHASVNFSALPEEEFPGAVTSIGAIADASTRTFPVEITFENPDMRIKPGMVAWVRLALSDAAQAITIPLVAVVKDKDGNPVAYVIDAQKEHVSARRLKLGRAFAKDVEVLDGLTIGEKIVVDGQHYVEDGQKIRLVKENGS